MKTLINIIVIFTFNCPLFAQTAIDSTTYTGPIIDMHLHAYSSEREMFKMTHPPTLRKETFEPTTSPEEQRQETLKRMEKYNIVLGIVTNGQLWKPGNEDRIIVAQGTIPIDSLRRRIKTGTIKVIAEVAPFYADMQANDPSLDAYMKLAEETGTPIGIHILPSGPNNGLHLMPEVLGGMKAENASPLQIEPILRKYPQIKCMLCTVVGLMLMI